MSSTTKPIRNFCIIAHIDHGKSTLADDLSILEPFQRRKMQDQVLDNMELKEKEVLPLKVIRFELIIMDIF